MLLSDDDLRYLRSGPIGHCPECNAQTWKNYCRECDEFFTAGHDDSCPQYSPHAEHRTY